MIRPRVIPCLLLKGKGIYKTIKFKNPKYVGDPINTVKILNEKEVDELVFLDISASIENKKPNFTIIEEIASECFMPLAYGGGINSVNDIKTLFSLGVEKVIINSFAIEHPEFINKARDLYGSQSIVVSIDVKMNLLGKYKVFTHSGTRDTGKDPVSAAIEMVQAGAGEILLYSIDRDGTMLGYDLNLIKEVSSKINIPLIACGGAWTLNHMEDAVKKSNASAVAAGSLFVFEGKHRAVLITYPTYKEIKKIFSRE